MKRLRNDEDVSREICKGFSRGFGIGVLGYEQCIDIFTASPSINRSHLCSQNIIGDPPP